MKKRVQLFLNDEAWSAVDSVTKEANKDFDVGNVSVSDAINEMILTARVDIKTLQLKHTNLRRTLRVLATKEAIDIDAAIKNLQEIKSKSMKRGGKGTNTLEVAE